MSNRRMLCAAATALAVAGSVGGAQPKEEQELRRLVTALAHDSLAGRPTPSPQLEIAARLVAAEFAKARLAPMGDDTSWFQRFPVSETVLDAGKARIEVGTYTRFAFGADFFWGGGSGSDPFGTLSGPAVIVTGAITRENAGALGLDGKIVFLVTPLSARGGPDYGTAFAIGGTGALGVVLAGGRPDSLWRRLGADRDELKPSVNAAWPVWTNDPARPRRVDTFAFRPLLELWGGRFSAMLRAASVDSGSLHAPDGSPKVTSLEGASVLHFDRRIERTSWPPNVVGVLEGSDPALRHEYVVVSAHLDGLGRAKGAPPGPASVLNGADDNASGVAAIVRIAAALAAAPSRPRRSVIFVAVSGEENGLWGSDWFAAHPPVPRAAIVANVNLDMVGRALGDTVFITGLASSAAGGIAADALRDGRRGLVVLGEQEIERRWPGQGYDEDRSDHANFRRRGIPSVHFWTGTHDDYHGTTDDADKLNYATLGRITLVAQDMVRALANAPVGTGGAAR